MTLLSNKERDTLEQEFNAIIQLGSYYGVSPELRERAKTIQDTLDKAYHTGVDFELKVIKGGK